MSTPNSPEVIAALQAVLDSVDLHRNRSDHPDAHKFMDAVQAQFEALMEQVKKHPEHK